MPTDFSKARIGDKVADRFMQKWGIIDGIYKNDVSRIHVNFGGKILYYMKDGRISEDHTIPALVWDMQKPEDDWSILPEMPKRTVKKKIEGWINVYPKAEYNYGDLFTLGDVIHKTKEKALKSRTVDALGEPLFISHEYEVEEDQPNQPDCISWL